MGWLTDLVIQLAAALASAAVVWVAATAGRWLKRTNASLGKMQRSMSGIRRDLRRTWGQLAHHAERLDEHAERLDTHAQKLQLPR